MSDRTDPKSFNDTLKKVFANIASAETLLAPFLTPLTDDERQKVLKPPTAFDGAARVLTGAATQHPDLAKVAGFDVVAVTEDLDNVSAIAPLTARLENLARAAADTELSWRSEAYAPSLALYRTARELARTNGTVAAVVTPLAEIFATRREKAQKPK
jgi:hypothetical protein